MPQFDIYTIYIIFFPFVFTLIFIDYFGLLFLPLVAKNNKYIATIFKNKKK